MNVLLLAITPGAELLIERAGRICYHSEPSGRILDTARFLAKRIEEGHLSIFEHASATFLIERISRACSHQLVRHRLCSFSQESQRYVDAENAKFVIPSSAFEGTGAAVTSFVEAYENALTAYQDLRRLGIKKEDARFVLPNATHTRLVMTANFREWRHILQVRLSPHAQWEIRQVCLAILDILHREASLVFGDIWRETRVPQGGEPHE